MPSYDFDKALVSAQNRVRNHEEISQVNKDLILKHDKYLAMEDRTKARRNKYLNILCVIGAHIDFNFPDTTVENVSDLSTWITDNPEWKPSTKKDYKALFKTFMKWMNGGDDYPECVRHLKARITKSDRKLPNDGKVLGESDIRKMIEACDNSRDKALIGILWETGARIGEIIDLTLGAIMDNPRGLKVTLVGKTGPRPFLLIESVPLINAWLTNHPDRENMEAPLWTKIGNNGYGSSLNYPGIRKKLKEIAKKAGINKPINPHAFRHGRATFLASRIKEQTLKNVMGWTQSSTQAQVYVHMSGRDTDRELLAIHGIEEDDNKQLPDLTPKECPRCKSLVYAGATFCQQCSLSMEVDYEEMLQHSESGLRDRIEAMEKKIEKMQMGILESILLSDFFAKDSNRKKQAELLLKDIENANLLQPVAPTR
ncbi:MAG TPA: site-specific integrase [Euryarchaeota archaeon]|nr:site-specific integrase [Euryarchaeota archaeon]